MDDQKKIEALLYAAKRGDLSAENQLFSLVQKMIFRHVLNKIYVLDYNKNKSEIRKDVEDLTGDICLIVFEKYKFSSLKYGFLPWVFRISNNKIGDYIRKNTCYNKTFKRLETSKIQNIGISRIGAIDKEIDNLKVKQLISTSLRIMEPAIQIIIKAILEDNIKDYILQQKVTIPVNTIYSRIRRSKCRLKKILCQNGVKVFVKI